MLDKLQCIIYNERLKFYFSIYINYSSSYRVKIINVTQFVFLNNYTFTMHQILEIFYVKYDIWNIYFSVHLFPRQIMLM